MSNATRQAGRLCGWAVAAVGVVCAALAAQSQFASGFAQGVMEVCGERP